MRTKPTVERSTPRAVRTRIISTILYRSAVPSWFFPRHLKLKLTIKLNNVVPDGLDRSPSRGFLQNKARINSLALVPEQDSNNGNAEANKDNSKGTERPAEVNLVVKQLSNLGAGESGRDRWRAVKAVDNDTIPQRRHVGEHNVDNVEETDVADPVERVAGSISVHVLADGLENVAEEVDGEQHDETLDTTPDVDDLGDGETAGGADDGGDDVDRRGEAVLVE